MKVEISEKVSKYTPSYIDGDSKVDMLETQTFESRLVYILFFKINVGISKILDLLHN